MQRNEKVLVEATRRALEQLNRAAAPRTAQQVVGTAAGQGIIVMPTGSRGQTRFPTRADGAEAGVVSGGCTKPNFG